MAKKDAVIGALSVTGEGQVNVKPDVARLRLGVLTEGKTASEAARANAEAMSRVVERLLATGVSRDALKTVGLSLDPIVEYQEGPNKNRIVGYRADNSLAVETSIELAGQVFDEAVGAGANESSSLSFGLADETAAHDKALTAAVKAAKKDAEAVARAMDVDLRGVRSIDVEPGGAPSLVRTARLERSATPVLGGELSVTARVRVVFETQG